MAKPYQPKPDRDRTSDVLFDVVVEQVVGTVRRGDGDLTPVEAAFLLIARHNGGEPGDYSFPHEQGGTVRVSVVCQPPPGVDPELWAEDHMGHTHVTTA